MSDEKQKVKKDASKALDQSEDQPKKQVKEISTKKSENNKDGDGKQTDGEKATKRNCMTLVAYITKLRKEKYPVIKFGGGSKSYISELAIKYALKLKRTAGVIARMNRRVTILEKDALSAIKLVQSPFGFFDVKTFTQGSTPKFKRTNIKPRKTLKGKPKGNPGPKNGGVKKPSKTA